MNTTATPPQADRVESLPAKDPAIRLFILAAMLLGFGGWCAWDMGNYGYVAPSENVNKFANWAFNHGGAAAFPLAALIPLAMAVKHLRRKLVADGNGIGLSDGPQIAWADIQKVDAMQLTAKGYLHLLYGQDQKLTIDTYKYVNSRDVLAFLEQHVPADRIAR